MKNIEELKKIKDALEVLINESEKPKFEVGKWYVLNCDYCFLVNISEIKGNNIYGYGFNYYGSINDYIENPKNNWVNIENLKSYHLATPKEVEEALIKEAEKRGLKEGTIINNSMLNDCSNTSCKAENNEYKFIEDELYSNCLLLDGFVIFLNGKWAEIVKTKTIDEIARDLSALSEYGIINYMSSTENKQTIIETLNNL